MHIVEYRYYPQNKIEINPSNISGRKNYPNMLPHDVSTMRPHSKWASFVGILFQTNYNNNRFYS